MANEKKPMRSFKALEASTKNESFKKIYSILGDHDTNSYVGDSKVSELVLSTSCVDQIKTLLYEEVKGRYVKDGIHFQSLQEAKQEYVNNVENYTKDGFFNPMTGTGTSVDPGTWNSVNTPVSMSPNEATSYYASGGLGKIIIDKKAKGALLNGYSFDAPFMSECDKEQLKEYAQSIGLDEAIKTGARDALIYGGSMCYPAFKKDNPDTYCLPLNQLVDEHIIEKDCIDRFVQADRWNCVIVPDYNITARDYLYPSTFFIPIGGIRVATARCAMIRPTKLPYWGVIRQIGWGTSDFEGYIRSILAYRIIIASVPIMAQQMSLLVHEIPLDGIIAQNGKDAADEFVKENNETLRRWSMNNPMTINSFGELKAINRTFTNYNDLIISLRQDIAANSGLAESVLFHTQPTGFSDNKEDITLKQSETLKSVNEEIMPAFKPIIKILIASCFGTDSEYFEKADRVRIAFESPEVVTNEERGKLLEKFCNGVAALKGASIPIKTSVEIAQQFLPDMKIPRSIIDKLEDENDSEEPASKPSVGFPLTGVEGASQDKEPTNAEAD